MATQAPPHPALPQAGPKASQAAPQAAPQASKPSLPAADQGGATELVANRDLHSAEDVAGNALDLIEEYQTLRLSAPLERLPVGVAVSVPVREFRVRNLLAMSAGEVIETQWVHGEDLPLLSGDVQLAWSEFEVVDTRLAVRVTRLA